MEYLLRKCLKSEEDIILGCDVVSTGAVCDVASQASKMNFSGPQSAAFQKEVIFTVRCEKFRPSQTDVGTL